MGASRIHSCHSASLGRHAKRVRSSRKMLVFYGKVFPYHKDNKWCSKKQISQNPLSLNSLKWMVANTRVKHDFCTLPFFCYRTFPLLLISY